MKACRVSDNRVIPTEHEEQVALFEWAGIASGQDPRLSLMFAIPNGSLRHRAVAAKLKAEGVRSGVPDVCLPAPSQGKHGLFIEMKALDGRPTDKQKGWIAALREQGYAACVCVGADQAISVIRRYLGSQCTKTRD